MCDGLSDGLLAGHLSGPQRIISGTGRRGPRGAPDRGIVPADMDSSTEQLYAMLNRKWQPDDDRHALILDGDDHFVWVGGTTAGPDSPIEYNAHRPEPSIGKWSVEDTKLVLRSGLTGKVEYAIEPNDAGDELTLTDQDGRSRHFTRVGETPTEHPASRAARRAKFGLPPGGGARLNGVG